MSGSDAIVLDLASLPEAAELLPEVKSVLAKAASYVLERQHGQAERDPAVLIHGSEARSSELVRVPVTDEARRTFGDPQVATEWGAEGVAILVARRVLDRVVFARLPKHTGADYRMRDPGRGDDDSYERLECSGIGDGSDTTRARLKEKVAQLAEYPELPPGCAIVTNFRAVPVEIMIGTHP